MRYYEYKKKRADDIDATNQALIAAAKANYDREKAAFDEEMANRRAAVDSFKTSYYLREQEAVEAYCSMVLDRSDYSDAFPQEFQLVYVAQPQEMVVEYELPTMDVVPANREYRYGKTRDEIQPVAMKEKERLDLYRRTIASKFAKILRDTAKGQAPWTFGPPFDAVMLERIADALPDLAARGIGGGDTSIRAAFNQYVATTPNVSVRVWSYDSDLASCIYELPEIGMGR